MRRGAPPCPAWAVEKAETGEEVPEATGQERDQPIDEEIMTDTGMHMGAKAKPANMPVNNGQIVIVGVTVIPSIKGACLFGRNFGNNTRGSDFVFVTN